MKRVILFAIVMNLAGCAGAQTEAQGQAMGALVGGTLGYILGDGSGHQKEIAAGAAVAGALVGGAAHNNRSSSGSYYNSSPYYGNQNRSYSHYDMLNHCRGSIPSEYQYNSGARNSWVNGCVSRLRQEQYELERRAYEEGYGR